MLMIITLSDMLLLRLICDSKGISDFIELIQLQGGGVKESDFFRLYDADKNTFFCSYCRDTSKMYVIQSPLLKLLMHA